MGGCCVSVQLNRSHLCRLLSRLPSFFQIFFTVWAALEPLCYVAREKGYDHAIRFAIIIRKVISVALYNLFTTDSWSGSVSGFIPFHLYFLFRYKYFFFVHSLPVPLYTAS